MADEINCVCCASAQTMAFTEVDGIQFYRCQGCLMVFADPKVLDNLDRGIAPRAYDDDYWRMELSASKERSFGSSLARMAEAFYYSRIPIQRFLDIGTGPGCFLDAVATYLPSRREMFFGVEKFPPPIGDRTRSPNYLIGDVSTLTGRFDGGICIEVVEHLTPAMMNRLLQGLAQVSNPQALYIVNTGLVDYVMHEDKGYLDPMRRGHIIAWSIESVRLIAEKHGFTVSPIRGKSWAFALEYRSRAPSDEDIRSRVWYPVPDNMDTLNDPKTGGLLRVLGMETVRAYAPM